MEKDTYYIVKIRNGRNNTYDYRNELKKMGFSFSRSPKEWKLEENNQFSINEYRRFARKNHLRIEVFSSSFLRDSSYRSLFFSVTSPHYHDKYFCAYCGDLLSKNEVSVDHIIPVRKVQKDRRYQFLAKMAGLTDINDIRNLCCSCLQCNLHKSSKGGLWILRGYIGKHRIFWFVSYVLCIVLFAAMLIQSIMHILLVLYN